MINQSINEVLSRTLITSGTVLIALIALLLMRGVLLRDFALALTIGVVVGTYSSVFVASPLVYIWPARRRLGAKASVKPLKAPPNFLSFYGLLDLTGKLCEHCKEEEDMPGAIKKPVKDLETLNNLLAGVDTVDTILFLIDRGGTTIFVTLTVEK